jgi:OOP family OmpA-OmpF porin
MKVYVDAYCDHTGKERVNSRLSRQRAAAVVNYIQNHGIGSERLIPRGFGATQLLARNDTATGRAQNRRIELVPIEALPQLSGSSENHELSWVSLAKPALFE